LTDSTVASPLADFLSRLNQERDAMRAFVALLEQEQQCLLDQDSEQLLSLAETKNQSANKLTEIANVRRQYLKANAAGLDTPVWLAKHAPSSLGIWEEIRELAARAHHLNQTNGEVIQLKLRSNQQALTALLGASKSAAGLYGRDGQPSLPVSGRILGSG
jgi:flagella synthesis protein FlgN